MGCRRPPGGAPPRQFFVADVQMDFARGDIDFDLVAGLHEGQRAADKTFRRDVQDTGAVTGAAHARVGDAQHVFNAGFEEFFRDRQSAPFRHARAAFRPAVFEHQHMVGRDVEIVAVDRGRHRVVILKGERFAAMRQQRLSAAAGFITQPRGARLPVSTAVAPSG